MATATTERGEETRTRILTAARTLFAEQGYQGTSIADVLAATELTKGGFYFHFASKAELAFAVMTEAKDLVNAQIAAQATGENALDDLFAIAHGAFHMCDSPGLAALRRLSEELTGTADAAGGADVHSLPWARVVEDLIRRAQHEGDIAPDVDAHSAGVIIIAAYFGLMEMAAELDGGTRAYENAFVEYSARILGVPAR